MYYRTKTILVPALSLFFLAALAAFRQKDPVSPAPPALADTVPAPKAPAPPRIAGFDEARRELDKAAAALEKNLENFRLPEPPQPPTPPQIDPQAIDQALKELNTEKIRAEVERQLKEVDAEKFRKEADAQLAKIDVPAMRREVETSMKKMQADMARQKEAFAKMQEELKAMVPKVQAEMQKAHAEIGKARAELNAYESFVDSLAAEGLINQSAYSIEHKNGKLILDGKEQPGNVYSKYRSFLEKHQNIRITRDAKGLNIQKD